MYTYVCIYIIHKYIYNIQVQKFCSRLGGPTNSMLFVQLLERAVPSAVCVCVCVCVCVYLLPYSLLRPIKEQKRPIKEQKRPIKEQKRPIQEQKRPIQEQKRPIKEQKRPIKEQKRPIQEQKRPIKEQRRPIKEPALIPHSGISRYLKDHSPSTKVYLLDCFGSALYNWASVLLFLKRPL